MGQMNAPETFELQVRGCPKEIYLAAKAQFDQFERERPDALAELKKARCECEHRDRQIVDFFAVTCYAKIMATTPKKSKPRTPQQRMAARRERLRAQGLRPVQHWVPDLRDPKIRSDLRRQAKLMARHPENDAIDAWNEAAYDWSDWK